MRTFFIKLVNPHILTNHFPKSQNVNSDYQKQKQTTQMMICITFCKFLSQTLKSVFSLPFQRNNSINLNYSIIIEQPGIYENEQIPNCCVKNENARVI